MKCISEAEVENEGMTPTTRGFSVAGFKKLTSFEVIRRKKSEPRDKN